MSRRHSGETFFFTHTSSSHKFGEKYGKGVTIGCGVNFKEETAFFTRNGELIDEWAQPAFRDIKGKLYISRSETEL